MALQAAWRQCVISNVLQRSSHIVGVIEGNAYVFGGELIPRQPRDNDVLKIDLKAHKGDQVQRLSSTNVRPCPRVGAASAVLNGKIYVHSGRGGEAMTPIEELGGLWEFEPLSDKWTLITPDDSSKPFPPARSYHCATTDSVSRIFVHAGCPASGRLSDLWSFDVITKAWTKHADAPAPPRGGSSIAFTQGRLYRMNGFDGKKEQGGLIDIYDLQANTWDFEAFKADGFSGPAPRSVSALLPINIDTKWYVVTMFGEGDPSALGHAGAGKMFDDVWAFDVCDNRWQKVDTRRDYDVGPSARGWFGATSADASTIFIAGGLAEDNVRLQDSWLLCF